MPQPECWRMQNVELRNGITQCRAQEHVRREMRLRRESGEPDERCCSESSKRNPTMVPAVAVRDHSGHRERGNRMPGGERTTE